MADLFLRQGHRAEAMAIYRRLLHRTADPAARDRIERRMTAVGVGRSPDTAAAPFASPSASTAARTTEAAANAGADAADDGPLGIPAVRARCAGDTVTVEWNLPARTLAPRLEILLVKRGPAGVEAETRAIDVDRQAGRIALTVTGLHLARAAAGYRTNGTFVPLARG